MNIFQATVKAWVWAFLRFLYRVRVRGTKNLPREGAAILVPNHVTFLDAMLIAAHVERPVRYAMYWKIFNKLKWIVAPMGAFPIASKEENQIVYDSAFQTMRDTLASGGLLCIFPEGKLTTDGRMNEFRPGILKLLESQPVPVIPVGLGGLWGSYFSRKKKGLFKLPEHWMAKITMVVGTPMPATVSLDDLRARVRLLAHGKQHEAKLEPNDLLTQVNPEFS